MEKPDCSTMAYWSQSHNCGTCWFNAILMTMFFSQHSRALLNRQKNKTKWKIPENTDLYQCFDYVLDNNFSFDIAYHKKQITDSQNLLKDLYGTYCNDEKLRNTIQKLTRIQFENIFDKYFTKYKNKLDTTKSISLNKNKQEVLNAIIKLENAINDYISKKSKYMEHQKFFAEYTPEKILMLLNKYDSKKYFITGKKLQSNPIFHIVPMYDLFNISCNLFCIHNNDIFAYNDFIEEYDNPQVIILYKSRQYTCDTKTNKAISDETKRDMLSHAEKIVYNSKAYHLDAIIPIDIDCSHAIAGITCTNKRYIYNGWKIKKRNLGSSSPATVCNLYEINWYEIITSEGKHFCLDAKECKLEANKQHEKSKELCFTLSDNIIYVYIIQPTLNALPPRIRDRQAHIATQAAITHKPATPMLAKQSLLPLPPKRHSTIIGGTPAAKYLQFTDKNNKKHKKKIYIINNRQVVRNGKWKNGSIRYVSIRYYLTNLLS